MWTKAHHTACDKALREDADLCADCFDEHFGNRLSDRRCYFCSTDAFWWGPWGEIAGHLACETCARERASDEASLVRARALYRAGNRGTAGTRTRAVEVYYQLADFKNNRGTFGYLDVPLGHVLGRSIAELIEEEDLGAGILVAPVPSADPERVHIRSLLGPAGALLRQHELQPELLSKSSGTQKELGGDDRRQHRRGDYIVHGDVAGRVVIVADDFITTGGSMEGCAQALVEAGADAVYGAAVARVINPPRAAFLPLGDNGSFVMSELAQVADTGRVVLGKGKKRLLIRFLCSSCPRMVDAKVRLPVIGETDRWKMPCDCGEGHRFRVERLSEIVALVTLRGRRGSDMLFAAA